MFGAFLAGGKYSSCDLRDVEKFRAEARVNGRRKEAFEIPPVVAAGHLRPLLAVFKMLVVNVDENKVLDGFMSAVNDE